MVVSAGACRRCRCASPALSLAERARGLSAISASGGGDRAARSLEGRRDRLGFRQMPRLRLLAGAVGDEALDDAVLERMEGDDGQPAAGLQRPLGGKQRAGELAELVIDEDAQRLEDAGRRVDLVLRIAADMRLDRRRQGRACARTGASRAAARSSRAMRPACRSSPRKPKMRARSPGLKRLTTSAAVSAGPRHAHVERAVGAEREAAIGLVELHRGDADVEHDAIDLRLGKFVEPRERPRAPACSRPAKAAARSAPAAMASGSRSIAMTSAPAASSALRIAAGAEGAVDDGVAGAGFERRQRPR